MITLYEGINDLTATFTSLPYPLNDAIDCTITEERNGQFSLVMRYPIGAPYWDKLLPDAIIMATPRPNASEEPFRIFEIEQIIDGIVTVRAYHIVYDLDGYSILQPTDWFNGQVGVGAILASFKMLITFSSPYRIFDVQNDGIVDTTSVLDFGNSECVSLFNILGKIASTFNAEVKYEWNTATNVCMITFCASRGSAKQTVISYGVNIKSLDRKLDYSGMYSMVTAYWINPNQGGLVLRVEGYATTQYTARTRNLYINVTDKYGNTVPTFEQLCDDAQAYIDANHISPVNDLSVEFVPMENTTESESPSAPPLRGTSTPYVKRPSGGGLDLGIRNSETDKVVGGTIAWNQLVQNGDFASTSGWSAQSGSRSVASNQCTLTATGNNPRIYCSFVTEPNHVYMFSAYVTPSVSTASSNIWLYSSSKQIYESTISISANVRGLVFGILKPDFSSTRLYIRPMSSGAVSGNTFVIDSVIGIDLTAMFGSSIADYLYTLESGTVGAGIAWLKSYGFFSEDYYQNHAATLESVQTSAHIMRDADDGIVGNYALDPDLVLRGIPKLDANNNLRYDGDVYESNGNVTRKYGIIDLGTLSWTKYSVSQGTLFRSEEIIGAKIVADGSAPNIMCQYPSVSQSERANMTASCLFANKVDIVDNAYANSTAQQFQTAMSGVYLVYELSTQTTETADPYTNPQTVDPHGTEQYVDAAYTAGSRDFEMPVGHETIYTFVPDDTSLYLCDTATVDASLIGVSATAKCVKVVYNEITGKYDSVTVGTIQTDIVDTILKLGE